MTDSVVADSSLNAIKYAYSIDCINVLAQMVTILSYFHALEEGAYDRNQVKISSSANHVVVNSITMLNYFIC